MRQTRQFGIRATGTTTFVECQFHVTTTTTYLSCSLNQWNCTCPRLFSAAPVAPTAVSKRIRLAQASVPAPWVD